jgi:Fe-S oxidoreductase
VILWVDTFNNHFHPQVLDAAVQTLEHLGCEVVVPQQPLCCGRPLLEFGWVDEARSRLQQVMQTLEADIRSGTPVVGLEPACVSMFKEDMHGLLPFGEQARRLRGQTVMLGDFVEQRLNRKGAAAWPRLHRRALVHAHCHHSAVLGLSDEMALLERLGLDHEWLDAGCCGMAGSFGFEREKFDVSMRCAERKLMPAMRSASQDTLLIANGYSCREQVAQCGVRRPLHLAEVLALALTQNQHAENLA